MASSMAVSTVVNRLAFTAGGSITRGHAVKLDTTENQVVQASAEGDHIIGVAMNDASSGDTVEVECGFGAKVDAVAGAALSTIGAQVEVNASGRFITAGGAAAVSSGLVLKTASGDGAHFTLLLMPSLKGPANS